MSLSVKVILASARAKPLLMYYPGTAPTQQQSVLSHGNVLASCTGKKVGLLQLVQAN